MDWSLPTYGDGPFSAPDVRYEWSRSDIESCRPDSFKGTPCLSMLASFDPPTIRRRSSTATTQSYRLQPSTPGSLSGMPSPGFTFSEPIGIQTQLTEDHRHRGPLSPQQHDISNSFASSYESELSARQSPLPCLRRKSDIDQADGPTSCCTEKCKSPSPRRSSKRKR